MDPQNLLPPCVPAYRFLTPAQIEHLHEATLSLLETVGVRVLLPDAVEMLRNAGGTLREKDIVRIPRRLVAAAPGQRAVANPHLRPERPAGHGSWGPQHLFRPGDRSAENH